MTTMAGTWRCSLGSPRPKPPSSRRSGESYSGGSWPRYIAPSAAIEVPYASHHSFWVECKTVE